VRRITLAVLATVAVVALLFSYRTSLGGSLAAPHSAVGGAQPGAGSTAAASSPGADGSTTLTGPAVETVWGPVQVQVVLDSSGKITRATAIQVPNQNGHDRRINAEAVPVLVQETLSAQSAKIDAVSGATVTSDGYISSLQAALDKRAG
jgi:uncharacterized protein with FMN-binding domain